MNSNKQWYIVYTKPRCEKKVAELLTKKKIQNYYPCNKVAKSFGDKTKVFVEPLFASYVFVKVSKPELPVVKQLSGVINMVYWLGEPAVIREVEVDMLQRFMNEHSSVQLEQTKVNVNEIVRVSSGPFGEKQTVSPKTKVVKMSLPSLGYTLAAKVEVGTVNVINSPNATRYWAQI